MNPCFSSLSKSDIAARKLLLWGQRQVGPRSGTASDCGQIQFHRNNQSISRKKVAQNSGEIFHSVKLLKSQWAG